MELVIDFVNENLIMLVFGIILFGIVFLGSLANIKLENNRIIKEFSIEETLY